ncbi:MAG: glycosyltransferase family 39 protein [Anaerolineae bacterium]|nr:glycosyltransferase family 39 protein [Anaerolineae bacterium]
MKPSPSRAEVAALVAILLVAAFLRVHDLDHAPPGLTHDEADHGRDAARVLEGVFPIYFTVGYGREPLYDYATALTMLAVGPTAYASRLTAAFFGLLLLPLTWAWARRAFGAGVGLLAAAFLAVDFWPVMVSRQALRSVTLPALLAAAVYCWWRGAGLGAGGRPPRRWAVAAGVLLGATFYTYLAARVMWVIFPALMAYLALFRRDLLRRGWRAMLLSLLIALLVSAPLFGWLLAHPGAETRLADLSSPLQAAAEGTLRRCCATSGEALVMFNLAGDPLWMYNLPGRPLLGPAQGLLFLGGLLMALVDAVRGRAAPAFLLIWVAAGLVPNAVTGVDAAVTRAVGLMPAVYILPAWALVALGRWMNGADRPAGEGVRRPFRVPMAPVAAALVALTGWTTYQHYFDLWTPAATCASPITTHWWRPPATCNPAPTTRR